MSLVVYGDLRSGNCYKIKLLLHFLGRPYEWRDVDILAGETQTEDFLKLNINKKIPVLVTEQRDALAESNAILNYLAENSPYLPDSGLPRAKVLEWQFFEQYSHEPYIAVARFIQKYLGLPEDRKDEYLAKQAGGHKALKVMEQHLGQQDYFVGDSLTIADISLYAYTHVAHEGGFDLSSYPNIQTWIKRIQSLPGYVGMED